MGEMWARPGACQRPCSHGHLSSGFRLRGEGGPVNAGQHAGHPAWAWEAGVGEGGGHGGWGGRARGAPGASAQGPGECAGARGGRGKAGCGGVPGPSSGVLNPDQSPPPPVGPCQRQEGGGLYLGQFVLLDGLSQYSQSFNTEANFAGCRPAAAQPCEPLWACCWLPSPLLRWWECRCS